MPEVSSLERTHIAGGVAFTLAVNGAHFVAKSVVNFSGKAEPTTFISTAKLLAAIPASDVATAGPVNVTVMNPAPGGGTSSAFTFTIDGYAISGQSGVSVTSTQPAVIQIMVTPTANGFPNPISFSVSGLPAGTTASFNPAMLTRERSCSDHILNAHKRILNCLPEERKHGHFQLEATQAPACDVDPCDPRVALFVAAKPCSSAHEARCSPCSFRTSTPDRLRAERLRARRYKLTEY